MPPVPPINSMNPIPCIVLELEVGPTPAETKIQIRHENMLQGWVTVAQILHQALGAVLPQAFGQLLQQQQKQEAEKRIVLAHGMNDLRR